ncbi:MAG: hypothetical protein ACHQ4G_08065 [Opitutales bacterium]
MVTLVTLVTLKRHPSKQVPTPETRPTSSGVGLTRLESGGGGSLVAEEAKFFDPTPLFLPTDWNAEQNMLPSNALRDPGNIFADYPAQLVFPEDSLALGFPATVKIPAKPSDAVNVLSRQAPYMGMGRSDGKIPVLMARGGFVEVVAADTGRRELAEALPAATPPAGNWRPLEMFAVVSESGLVGQLSFVERSGVEDVDTYFQNYLVKNLHLGDRLPPGFYRICVGP